METDRSVRERLEFTTVAGAEDLLRENVAAAAEASDIRMHEGRITCSWGGPVAAISSMHLAHGVQMRADDGDLLAWLHRSSRTGVCSLYGDRQIRFRVGELAGDERRSIISTVEGSLGWHNDVSDWDLNLERDRQGWIVDIGSLHWNARHLKLERQSFSTPTAVANVLVRLAKLGADPAVLDPFCGAATNLVVANRQVGTARLIGVETVAAVLDLAARNLAAAGVTLGEGGARLIHGRAERLPLTAGSVDRVVSNLPFGKRVGSHEVNAALYPAFSRELARVLSRRGRAVLLSDDKALLRDSIARTGGIKIVSERVLRYGGVTPTCFVVSRSRR